MVTSTYITTKRTKHEQGSQNTGRKATHSHVRLLYTDLCLCVKMTMDPWKTMSPAPAMVTASTAQVDAPLQAGAVAVPLQLAELDEVVEEAAGAQSSYSEVAEASHRRAVHLLAALQAGAPWP